VYFSLLVGDDVAGVEAVTVADHAVGERRVASAPIEGFSERVCVIDGERSAHDKIGVRAFKAQQGLSCLERLQRPSGAQRAAA
jgi:hypothetical protein